MVLILIAADGNGQRVLPGDLNTVERHLYGAYGCMLVERDVAPVEPAATQHLACIIIYIIVDARTPDITIHGVVYLDRHHQAVGCGVDKLGKTRQWHDGRAELSPLTGIGISLLTPMDVERPDKCRTLATIVVQSQKLETGIVAGAQIALNLIFITECLQFTARHQEFLSLRSHAVIAEQVAEDFKVTSLIDTSILGNLPEVGESAPLPLFMGDDRRVVINRVLIVARTEYLAVVVVIATGGTTIPVKSTGTTLDMILGAVIPGPTATDRSTAVDAGGIVTLHFLNPEVTILHPITGWFIARSHHDKGGVMTVCVNDALALLQQITINRLSGQQLHTVVRPRRTFWLEVETHFISCCKSRIRRTIGMESHMVETVFLTFSEDTEPRCLIRRRVTRLREATILHRASQEDRMTVQNNLPSIHQDLTHSKGCFIIIITYADTNAIEIGMELVPQERPSCQRHLDIHHVGIYVEMSDIEIGRVTPFLLNHNLHLIEREVR